MSRTEFTEAQVLELARQGYRTGNAGYSVETGECALLVIDMQEEFVKPGWTPYWVPEATRQVPKIKKLIAHCRLVGIPLIYTVYSYTHHRLDRYPFGKTLPNRFPDLDLDQSPYFLEGRVVSELQPAPQDVVIQKPSYGAFCDTPLDMILKNLRRNAVIICGTMTNYCCGTTARQAYERGYKVVFGSDVTATDDPALQEAELMVLRRGFAKVWSLQQIIDNLAAIDLE